jgi:alpha-L-rhamnosidase
MPNELLRRRFLLGLVPAAAVAAATTGQAGFNVRDHGAAGDGTHLDTRAIQEAIDACARAGGGTVFFPAGA